MAPQAPRPKHSRHLWLAASLLTVFAAGCNPGAITMLLLPFMDDKVPPKCKLSKKKEETTVVIYTSFPAGERSLDMEPVSRELADALSVTLKKRLVANKEKVTIVSPAKVQSYKNGRLGKPIDDTEIGEHFKADYVVNLEIANLTLYEHRSKHLFRGNTEITVTVTDMNAGEGENRIFSEIYRTAYPSAGPIDAGGSSPTVFRAAFLNKVSRDISRWFAAFPKDERMDMD